MLKADALSQGGLETKSTTLAEQISDLRLRGEPTGSPSAEADRSIWAVLAEQIFDLRPRLCLATKPKVCERVCCFRAGGPGGWDDVLCEGRKKSAWMEPDDAGGEDNDVFIPRKSP